MRIVLAEDHRMFREAMRLECERVPGCKVLAETDSGDEAVLLCERHKPDLLILDLGLPDRSGLDEWVS